MRRILILLVFVLLGGSFAAQTLPQKGAGPGKPLTPQEAQKLFKIDDGLRIELVACEPQIESPVAMQFAPDGRLWVVEMRDYPNGPKKGEKPAGRIKVLEDKDGDGFFETSTIWADNLLFANGIFLWKDGALVTMAPRITHLRDPNGVGKATVDNNFYTGFTAENPQLRVSHPIMGPDGWIYCANGLRGGKVTFADGSKKKRPLVDLSGMDFRFDPLNPDTKYEAITGPGQFGNTFDEWGNRFVCDNRHHLRHVVMENRYIKRNPYLAAPSLLQDTSILEDGPLSSGGKIYPISKNWTTSSLHEGRFTAACGVFIYHGKLLKPRGVALRDGASIYYGAAFTCDPTGNLVHMEILRPKGATFESRPHRRGVEFLASPDDWFRPVFLTHGPDGAMYVVDMYRAVIEHPQFMPPELKNRPDLTLGKDKGRIWRIVPKDYKFSREPLASAKLSKASIADLVKTLEHAEPWWRQTAQRLLLEKNDKAMIEPLTKLLKDTKSPQAKILAAWMLERQGKLELESSQTLLVDNHPRVREHAIRIAEPHWIGIAESDLKNTKANTLNTLLEKSFTEKAIRNETDSRVLFQLSLSFGSWSYDAARPATGNLLNMMAHRKQNDPWIRLALLTGLAAPQPWIDAFIFSLAKEEPPNDVALIRQYWAMIPLASKGLPEWYVVAYAYTTRTKVYDDKWAGLFGLAEGLERCGKTFVTIASAYESEKERKEYLNSLDVVFDQAAKASRDGKRAMDQRVAMVRIIGHAPWPTAKSALVPLVEKETNIELRIAALRALASQKDKEVPTLLMKLWPGATPSLRREILEAMLRQPLRVNVLLDEIESKRMKASELDPLRTRQLLNHRDGPIRIRAKKLLANNLPADRAKVLAQYQAALMLKGDARRGRDVFKKECAVCHRVAGIGTDVGPDIADTRTKTLGAMLNDIIAPNSAIDNNFVNYVVSTKDGRILTGLLTAETASSLTLVRAEKQMDVILRKDIDEIASTGISLMPEGMEKNISVQQMADLLRFLKDWRYLDGSVPLGK